MKTRKKIFQKTILENKYITHTPTVPQARFLLLDELEALYGGSAGGGKSDAILMGALQFVMVPNYSSIIFRRTLRDLQLPDALIPRSHEWLEQFKELKWRGDTNTWYFPSGATLTFGYLQHETDKYRYQGAQFQYIGWDELTQFEESQYRYLISRVRRLKDSNVPLRIRAASNPGGVGHDWVKQRFVMGDKTFIPARLYDNPYLDRESYEMGLMQLDPVTRKQLLEGDWSARQAGGLFKREWFQEYTDLPIFPKVCRFWDMASTEKRTDNNPDYTCGVLMGRAKSEYYVLDVVRGRWNPAQAEAIIRRVAERDEKDYGDKVKILMEEEPGSSGKYTIYHFAKDVLAGFPFYGIRTTGSKENRAAPYSSACEQKLIYLPESAQWRLDYVDELEAFPESRYKDQVDASSGAFRYLSRGGLGPIQASTGVVVK